MNRIAALAALFLIAGVASARQEEKKLSGSELIDSIVRAKWESQEIKPVSKADDAEWLRRVCLDAMGRIPSPEMTSEFLASKAADKRAKLLDEILNSDEYATYWAEYWTGTFLGYDLTPQYEVSYYGMLKSMREVVKKTAKLDEIAKALITPEGKTSENGLGWYLVREQMSAGQDAPLALAGKYSKVFLGIQIQCAQCHDHPFDKWTQEDMYGMGGFFTKVRASRVDPNDLKQGFEIATRPFGRPQPGMGLRGAREGDLTIPGQKEAVKTKFLATAKGPQKDEDKRAAFARILTSKETAQFARAAVNRYWGHFFGVGIVDPIDEFTEKNKAWSPELLDRVGADFAAHAYDVKWLIKSIALSEAYQLTAKSKKGDRDQTKAFARARTRPLSPEQLIHSTVRAMGMESAYGDGEATGGPDMMGPGKDDKDKKDDRPLRRLQGLKERRALLDAVRQFRFNFGDDEGADKTEFQGTIPQALLMMNSELVAAGLSTKGQTRIAQILKDHKTPAERVTAIYLAVLSRPPSDAERAKYARYAATKGDEGYVDVMWTLLNSSEFLLNH
jgi:hypothetical protein